MSQKISTNAVLEVILPDTLVSTNDISVLRMAIETNQFIQYVKLKNLASYDICEK